MIILLTTSFYFSCLLLNFRMGVYYTEKAIDEIALSSLVFVTEFYMPKCVYVLIGRLVTFHLIWLIQELFLHFGFSYFLFFLQQTVLYTFHVFIHGPPRLTKHQVCFISSSNKSAKDSNKVTNLSQNEQCQESQSSTFPLRHSLSSHNSYAGVFLFDFET